MDPKQFAELHAKCWETLKHYVHEADRMCELFGQCLPEPTSIRFRSDTVEQRVRENNAYTSEVFDLKPTSNPFRNSVQSRECQTFLNC